MENREVHIIKNYPTWAEADHDERFLTSRMGGPENFEDHANTIDEPVYFGVPVIYW